MALPRKGRGPTDERSVLTNRSQTKVVILKHPLRAGGLRESMGYSHLSTSEEDPMRIQDTHNVRNGTAGRHATEVL